MAAVSNVGDTDVAFMSASDALPALDSVRAQITAKCHVSF